MLVAPAPSLTTPAPERPIVPPANSIGTLSLMRSVAAALLSINVPTELTVIPLVAVVPAPVAPLPRAPLAAALSVPVLTMVEPVKVLFPARVTVPAPALFRLPLPLIEPLTVRVLPLLSRVPVKPLAILILRVAARVTLPPEACSVLVVVGEVSALAAKKILFVATEGARPRLVSPVIARMPPRICVPFAFNGDG